MPLRVVVNTPRSARVRIEPAKVIDVDVAKFTQQPFKLEDLLDVDHTTNGVVTGSEVIFDAGTGKWVTQIPVDDDNLDGGSY